MCAQAPNARNKLRPSHNRAPASGASRRRSSRRASAPLTVRLPQPDTTVWTTPLRRPCRNEGIEPRIRIACATQACKLEGGWHANDHRNWRAVRGRGLEAPTIQHIQDCRCELGRRRGKKFCTTCHHSPARINDKPDEHAALDAPIAQLDWVSWDCVATQRHSWRLDLIRRWNTIRTVIHYGVHTVATIGRR